MEKIEEKIFNIKTDSDFNEAAIEIFNFQYQNNKVYRKFVDLLNVDPYKVLNYSHIPFLPIEFFKSHEIVSFKRSTQRFFESSGTTSMARSHHYIFKESIYKQSLINSFLYFYGKPEEYCILALTPDKEQSPNSSLVYMLDELISNSIFSESGFYLDRFNEISKVIDILDRNYNQPKIMLFGLTYALLDLSEITAIDSKNIIIVETGGMKGRRNELTRPELYSLLKSAFKVKEIHSEYSMTELLSQAYSRADGFFYCPPWMKIIIRDLNDYSNFYGHDRAGAVNIIDLANIYSCSFIATQDIGKTNEKGAFEILGRFDHSDIRGCSLLYQ